MEDTFDLDLLKYDFQEVINELKAAREQLKPQIPHRVSRYMKITDEALGEIEDCKLTGLINQLKQGAIEEAASKGYQLVEEPTYSISKAHSFLDNSNVLRAEQSVLLTPMQFAELRIEQLKKEIESLESRLEENDD